MLLKYICIILYHFNYYKIKQELHHNSNWKDKIRTFQDTENRERTRTWISLSLSCNSKNEFINPDLKYIIMLKKD